MSKKKKCVPRVPEPDEWIRAAEFDDGLSLDDLPGKTDEELMDMLFTGDDSEDIASRGLGYYDSFVSENSYTQEDLAVVYRLDDLYFVVRMDEFQSDLLFVSKSKDAAIQHMNDIPYGEHTVEYQIKEAKSALSDISGLYFDCKGHYWNIKYNYNMLIEKANSLNEAEIRREVERFENFKNDLKETYGITVKSIYKLPREWNNNQRYYMFELSLDGNDFIKEAHIPSSYQGRKRFPIDFFNNKWPEEIFEESKARAAMRSAMLERSHKLVTCPFNYDMFQHLRADLNKAKAFEKCDGTLRLTEKWLRKHMPVNFDTENAIGYLERRGGFCDCEVLMNTDDPEYWSVGIVLQPEN